MSTNTDALKSNLGEAGTHLKQAASAAGEALKSAAVACSRCSPLATPVSTVMIPPASGTPKSCTTRPRSPV